MFRKLKIMILAFHITLIEVVTKAGLTVYHFSFRCSWRVMALGYYNNWLSKKQCFPFSCEIDTIYIPRTKQKLW